MFHDNDEHCSIKICMWTMELDKLMSYNDFELNENIFKYITKSKFINDFYNNQLNIKQILKENSDMIFFVKNQTEELCKLAVSYSGFSLEYIKNQTYDICKKAVQQTIQSFKFVDKKLQTKELCIISLIRKKTDTYPFNIQYVREDLLTYDLWKIAIQNHGLSIKYMNLDYQTYELCLLAVKNCKEQLLINIKSQFHTDELIEIEKIKNKFSRKFIKNPIYLIDKNIPEEIIKKEIEQCIICHEIKKYYFQYECGHISCFDCKLYKCYYNCTTNYFENIEKDCYPDINILYINTNFS